MKTRGSTLTVATLALTLVGSVAGAQTADAVASDFLRAYIAAVEARDVPKLMALVDGDAFVVDETNANVMPTNRAQLEETSRAFVAGVRSFKLAIVPVRTAFLKPDVLLSEGHFEGSGMATDGQPVPPMKGLWVMTLVKRPAGWKLAALGSFLATTPAP